MLRNGSKNQLGFETVMQFTMHYKDKKLEVEGCCDDDDTILHHVSFQ